MPTINEVNEAVEKFDKESEPYEWLVRQLFQKYPRNTDPDQVFLKTMVLNKIYNAGVLAELPVAKHIVDLVGIDPLILAGSDDAVRRIANVRIKKRNFCFLSFASKYCSWHNPTAYPIFDKNVRVCLRYYRTQDHFAKFTLDSLWNYPTFRGVVNEFRTSYDLDLFNYKDLDKFMWLCGKKLRDEKRAAKEFHAPQE